MATSVEQQIREQYPSMAWLLKDPEIGQLLRDAVDPSKGFSPQAFEAKVKGTKWYTSRTQAQRDWEILWNTDKATARQRLQEYTDAIYRTAQRLGVNINPNQLKMVAAWGVQRGIDPSSPDILGHLSRLYGGQPASGAITTASNRMAAIAAGEFLMPVSKKQADIWGRWIATGVKTEEDMREQLRNMAISKFPYLAKQIQAGETPETIFAPHRQTIANELELSPGEINLADGKWSKVLGLYDRSMKQTRPMTIYEAQTLARQDERFWKTSKGGELQAGLTNTLLKTFGKRA